MFRFRHRQRVYMDSMDLTGPKWHTDYPEAVEV